jgi:hypothetical protein
MVDYPNSTARCQMVPSAPVLRVYGQQPELGGSMTTDTLPISLEECHQLIRQLEEENLHLRRAGSVFGQLAERLNQELRAERGDLYAGAGGVLHERHQNAWESSPG